MVVGRVRALRHGGNVSSDQYGYSSAVPASDSLPSSVLREGEYNR